MNAVWTILGCCTADAGAVFIGAGMITLSAGGFSFSVVVPGRSLPLPLASGLGLLAAEAGAEDLVGVVTSMGSPGDDGADIFMIGGSRIGTVLAPIRSSGRSSLWFRGGLLVIVASCSLNSSQSVIGTSDLRQSVESSPKTKGRAWPASRPRLSLSLSSSRGLIDGMRLVFERGEQSTRLTTRNASTTNLMAARTELLQKRCKLIVQVLFGVSLFGLSVMALNVSAASRSIVALTTRFCWPFPDFFAPFLRRSRSTLEPATAGRTTGTTNAARPWMLVAESGMS